MEGTVDRNHNRHGTRRKQANPALLAHALNSMKEEPYKLDEARRPMVLTALQNIGARCGWDLLAAHVRTNHVHVVVVTDRSPVSVMTQMKAAASAALNSSGIDGPRKRRWARHGSTRYLFTSDDIANAIRYTVDEQGQQLSFYVATGGR